MPGSHSRHRKSRSRSRSAERRRHSRSRSHNESKSNRRDDNRGARRDSRSRRPLTSAEREEEEQRKKHERLAKARMLAMMEVVEEKKIEERKDKKMDEIKEVPKGFSETNVKETINNNNIVNIIELNPISKNSSSPVKNLAPIFKSSEEPSGTPLVAPQVSPSLPAASEDPLDAYMNTIINTDKSLKDIINTNANVITMDDIKKEAENATAKPEDDENYYKEFIQKIKNNSASSQNIVNTIVSEARLQYENEDDDNFILALEGTLDEDDYVQRQKRNAERKELKPVDHSKIHYNEFRKSFYIESSEIARMDEEEVRVMRKELGKINIRGLNCPKPVKNWYQCGLSDRILQIIEFMNFKHLFAIQAQAIPAIMSGRDVIAIAETGSGKTLAFVLPMLRHVLDQPLVNDGEGPIALILAPTRELANQIYNDIKVFTKHLQIRAVCIYGGANVSGQLSDLKKGSEIVVCTPGRMIDVLTTSNGKITNLSRVTYVVLDEADRMLDLGFGPQISKILNNIRPDRQIIMTSATFPQIIANLAKKALNNPIEIVVGNRGQTCKNIHQIIEVIEESKKLPRLFEILVEYSNLGSVLIFVDSQEQADTLFKELFTANYKVLVLHGGQDQMDREFFISDFKKGVRNIMVATSILARGLDIKSIILVVNYSCPNHTEDYVHRIGRTGRAGNKGTSITFITPDESRYAGEIIKAIRQSENSRVPAEL